MSRREFQARYLPHRTLNAIIYRAQMLGVRHYALPNQADWTDAEDALIRRHYAALPREEFRRKYLPNRTIGAIKQHAEAMGVNRGMRGKRWSPKQVSLLRRWYGQRGGITRLQAWVGRSAQAIRGKAVLMGIHRRRDNAFTPQEDAVIRRDYPTKGLSTVVGSHPASSIHRRARQLGIECEKAHRRWTPAEDALLRRKYCQAAMDLMALFPGRTLRAINRHRWVLGLSYSGTQR